MKRINGIILTLALLVAGALTVKAQKSETLSHYECSITYSFSGGKITESNEEHPFEHYYKVDISPGETITATAKANDKKFVNMYMVEEPPYVQFVFRAFDDAGKEIKNETHTSGQMDTEVNFSYTVPANCDHIKLSMSRPISAPRYAKVEVTFNVKKNAPGNTDNTGNTGNTGNNGLVFKYGDLHYKILSGKTVEVTGDVRSVCKGHVEIPNMVKHGDKTYQVVGIGKNAFADQTQLTSIVIPKTIRGIAENAFRNTGLKDVVIPGDKVSIVKNAFLNSKKLTLAVVSGKDPKCSASAFMGCSSMRELRISNISENNDGKKLNGTNAVIITGNLNIKETYLKSLSTKFVVIKDGEDKKKWYVLMNYPVSYGDYYGVTGINKRPRNANIFDVITSLSEPEKRRFVKAINSIDSRMQVRIATANQLQNALSKKYNISSENGPYSIATNGFYLYMSYNSYLRMRQLRKQYWNW